MEKVDILMDSFVEATHKFYNFETFQKISELLPIYQFQKRIFGRDFANTYATNLIITKLLTNLFIIFLAQFGNFMKWILRIKGYGYENIELNN